MRPRTSGRPGLMMPPFSAAISVSVSPSHSVWSRPIVVITAASAEARIQYRRHGTLAVRAGDVKGGIRALRIPQALQCQRHALELEIHALGRLEGVQPVERALVVVHRSLRVVIGKRPRPTAK